MRQVMTKRTTCNGSKPRKLFGLKPLTTRAVDAPGDGAKLAGCSDPAFSRYRVKRVTSYDIESISGWSGRYGYAGVIWRLIAY